jgi:uncharacterized RDD family membrane protein YckC
MPDSRERIVKKKNLETTAEKPQNPIFRRLIAFLIDWYFSSLFAMLPVVVFQSINNKDLVLLNRIDTLTRPQAVISTLIALGIYTLYFCVIPLSLKDSRRVGQTLGRWIFHITLVNVDGSPLAFSHLFLRDFVGILLLQGNLTSVYIYLMSLVEIFSGSVAFVPYVQLFYYLVIAASLIMLFTRKRQTVHDFISGTRMIAVKIED